MYRQIALIAATALILAGCGSAPAGLATAQNGAVSALGKTTAKKDASEYEHLVVQSVAKLRDGGTVVLKGYINRSTYVTLRFDNALSSKTQGQIFMTISGFMISDPEVEKEVTPEQAAALAKGIRSNMKRAGADLDVKLLDQAADMLDQAAKADTKDPFAGLEIVSLDSQPVRCPCFTLTAKAGDTTVTVDFEGLTDPLTVTRVSVNGREATEAQTKALRPALEKAAGAMKDKKLGARVKQIAKSL